MDLITTHLNADFDALGSLVAAKKLYPDSRLLLPGSQEESVRHFLSLAKDIVVVESEKECNMEKIDRLVLVDTRQRSRIGTAARLVDRGVEVHVYDHHPASKDDIVADKDTSEEVGATVTILSDIIRRRRIKLSNLEATIMLLGIYEETGSLTYRTTTKLDVDMVSFLLSQGANLSIVSSYLNRELSESELSMLTRLINSTERHVIKGIVVATIEIGSESYVGELGMLIHKLLDIENIPVLFVFINNAAHGRVDVIARSKLTSIDVNKILGCFGGGGHISAASAKVRTDDLPALKEKILKVMKRSIKVEIRAKDIMAKGVKTINVNRRLEDAKKIMLDGKISGVPVVDRKGLVGLITMSSVNKAMRHGYGHSRVKGYMTPSPVTVKQDTPLHAIHKIVLERDIGVIPVMKGAKIVGAIYRTDVLKNVYSGLLSGPKYIEKRVVTNLSKKMSQCFSGQIMALLRKIGRMANSEGYSAFVVGGLVRDLLLGYENLDLDIVIEGNAIQFGSLLRKELKGALVVHRKFGTCTVITPGRLKIDLATARKEIYARPAALPTVEYSSLKNDLIRRDFTINAMAISINKATFGQLVDFFGGEEDLVHGRIRALHANSFIDDPTRIFRAVRFEQRLGFTIEKETEEIILNAIKKKMIEVVEPQRLRDEIILILSEHDALKALKRMAELHELKFIHPRLKLEKRTLALYPEIDKACHWYEDLGKKRPIEKWLVYLMALTENLTYKELSVMCHKFVFKNSDTTRLLSYKKYGKKAKNLLSYQGTVLPSEVYKLLEPLSYETSLIILAEAKSGITRARIKAFIQKYGNTRIDVRGDDIKKLGLKPGPHYKNILKKILYNKIDGKLRTKKDEIGYARKMIERVKGSGGKGQVGS